MRAAAEALVEVLASQTAANPAAHGPQPPPQDPLAQHRELFPGLGAPVRYEVAAGSAAIGRSLADLELRSATGATVLAIVRDGESVAVPGAREVERAGDVLAIAGTADAIAAACVLLERADAVIARDGL
jgi:CPA2 family monovalent cation:H+ antiporter-2